MVTVNPDAQTPTKSNVTTPARGQEAMDATTATVMALIIDNNTIFLPPPPNQSNVPAISAMVT
jgi:hypothetical protein